MSTAAAHAAECVIVKPAAADPLEDRAAAELARYAGAITGREPAVVTDAEPAEARAGRTRFLLGTPERNVLVREFVAAGQFRRLRDLPAHPDAFAIISHKAGGADVLLLAGRRPIGTLYAVYEYLAERCGVGFFQDGEAVPHLSRLPADGSAAVYAPRFDHRLHFCWNAHRGIKKYHAFWWTLEDWQREFDWMVKRRMNMLRLDMGYYGRFAGDAFRQAFPEIGPEPDEVIYPRFAGWTVDWGWPPAYRRELTQKIFEYGRSLGIRFIYSLAYAAVPFRFKDVHPEYTYLPGNQYGESRQIHPDDPGSYEVERAYLAKCIELFGTDHLYMYTPYAEIDVGDGSAERNLRMRIQAARQILRLIADVDPQGLWVTDTWDLHAEDRWDPGAVKTYFDSFPSERMYVYETAADVAPLHERHNFWHGKRWAFGILHSFAGKETLHGHPRRLVERVRGAAACGTCTGLFFVPEMTHHNVMFWDLATHLAWQPADVDFDRYLTGFVRRRYGRQVEAPMLEAWRKIVEAVYSGPEGSLTDEVYGGNPWHQWVPGKTNSPLAEDAEAEVRTRLAEVERQLPLLADALAGLLECRPRLAGSAVYVEDVVVAFRTWAGKCFDRHAAGAYLAFKAGDSASFEAHRARAMAPLHALADVLAACPSYSINKTIAEACDVPGHHPRLPELIRQNCINVGYVTNDVYEQLRGQYVPKTQAYFDLLAETLAADGRSVDATKLKAAFERIDADYRGRGWDGPAPEGDAIERVAERFSQLRAPCREAPSA